MSSSSPNESSNDRGPSSASTLPAPSFSTTNTSTNVMAAASTTNPATTVSAAPPPAMPPLKLFSEGSAGVSSMSAGFCNEEEPVLTNASIALAEFTSLLKPAESNYMLREHIIELLGKTDSEDALVRVARLLESPRQHRGGGGGGGHHEDDGHSSFSTAKGTDWYSHTVTTPTCSVSESTSLSNTGRRRSSMHSRSGNDVKSFGAIAGLSFLHSRRMRHHSPATTDTTSEEDAAARSLRTGGGGMLQGGRSMRSYSTQTDQSADSPSTPTHGGDAGGASTVDHAAHSANEAIATALFSRSGHHQHLHHVRSSRVLPEGVRDDPLGVGSPAEKESHSDEEDGKGSTIVSPVTTSAAQTIGSQSSASLALHVDPLTRAVPQLPTAVRNEGRRVAVSAAPFDFAAFQQNHAEGGAADTGLLTNQSFAPIMTVDKTPAEAAKLRRLVKRCHIFSKLESADLDDVVSVMAKEVHAAGTAVLEQGQESKEKLYLVAEGTCEVIKNGKSMGPLLPGTSFGELELMYKQAQCAATIRCVTKSVFYTMDEMNYHRIILNISLQKRQRYENLLQNVSFLRSLPDYERMKIAEALETRLYKCGQAIIRFGSRGTAMHFIMDGVVKVMGRQGGRRVEVVRLHSGDVVGELELLFGHLAVADVVVSSKRAVTACISREHFELIVGPIQDRLKEFIATSSTYQKYVNDVADTSVRSELSRIESARKHRRVTPREKRTTVDGVDSHGEVLFSVPATLLSGNARENDLTAALQQSMRAAAAGYEEHVPQSVLRFPLVPLTGKDTVLMALREDGLIAHWNDTLARVTGYPAEEVVGQNVYTFLLEDKEQQAMYKAISAARAHAGDVSEFMSMPQAKRSNTFTMARSDGLTKASLRLSVVPPMTASADDNAAEVVLVFGEELKDGPQNMLEQPQWLSVQIRTILADGGRTYEERLQLIAETLNSFEATFRAMTVSTERLRVVNIRQMLGHVMMDFGADCVVKGLSVRQRFDGLPNERAYLDADLLPECLRYAMSVCLRYHHTGGALTITTTLTESNGLEFLVINFNINVGGTLPSGLVRFFDPTATEASTVGGDTDGSTLDVHSSRSDGSDSDSSDGEGDGNETRLHSRHWRRFQRVKRAVEQQGGTMRVQCNLSDSNIVFLIPFMPASAQEEENALVEDSFATQGGPLTSRSTSMAAAANSSTSLLPRAGAVEGDGGESHPSLAEGDAAMAEFNSTANDDASPPAYNFTTLVAEDTPAQRNMLCSFLWERRHAVLPAYSIDDIDRLAGVADILIIDLQQSIMSSFVAQDPITLLKEKSRQMAIIITAKDFDLVSVETYAAAGFVTLKKPCTPVQAMQAIHKAETKIAMVKREAERIAQTRETLARNSRGAWKRGELLGKGTFGEVYEAVDVLTGGKMAVKEMSLGKHNLKVEQFVEEISTMCNLQHPNIIHYFYCEESADQRVIRVFMEHAAGGSLQTLLTKRGKLSLQEYRALLHDVVEGINYIHSQHYVHCDIKTANVLLSQDGKGKIGDFGTARTVRDGQQLYDMQGSPLYMSPECMSAGEVDEETGQRVGYSFPSDIWSLGCVAMEMATGKPPYAHIKSIKGAIGLTKYITSLTDTPDLSPLFKMDPAIIEFVSACLNPDPALRPTAQELLNMTIFSDATDDDTKSALKSLKRAQLLHVLNKFVAFQEPEEAERQQAAKGRFITRKTSMDFFDSSSSSSSSSKESGKDRSSSGREGADGGPRRRSAVISGNSGEPLPKGLRQWTLSSSSSSSSASSSSGHRDGTPARPPHARGATRRADSDDEPEAQDPNRMTEDDGYDLSPTPKKRSKTQSRPAFSPSPPRAPVAERTKAPKKTKRAEPSTSTAVDSEDAFFSSSASSASPPSSPASPALFNEADEDPRDKQVTSTAPPSSDTAPLKVEQRAASEPGPMGLESPSSSPYSNTGLLRFEGRRRNVIGDEFGNLVTVADHSSKPSSVSGHSQPSAKTKVSAAPLPASPSPSSHGRPQGLGAGGGGPVVNMSFAQAPNMSFFNYSFNKNISFMGANMDDVLNGAATEFLTNLANGGDNGAAPNAAAHARSGSALPSRVEKESSDMPSSMDGTNSEVGPSSTSLVPQLATPETRAQRGPGGSKSNSAASTRDHASPEGPLPPLWRRSDEGSSRSPSAAKPSPSPPPPGALDANGDDDNEQSKMTYDSEGAASPEVRGSTSSPPREESIPLVGPGRPGARPPVSNRSFFVVEDLVGAARHLLAASAHSRSNNSQRSFGAGGGGGSAYGSSNALDALLAAAAVVAPQPARSGHGSIVSSHHSLLPGIPRMNLAMPHRGRGSSSSRGDAEEQLFSDDEDEDGRGSHGSGRSSSAFFSLPSGTSQYSPLHSSPTAWRESVDAEAAQAGSTIYRCLVELGGQLDEIESHLKPHIGAAPLSGSGSSKGEDSVGSSSSQLPPHSGWSSASSASGREPPRVGSSLGKASTHLPAPQSLSSTMRRGVVGIVPVRGTPSASVSHTDPLNPVNENSAVESGLGRHLPHVVPAIEALKREHPSAATLVAGLMQRMAKLSQTAAGLSATTKHGERPQQ